ncbi:MAG: hypothetical protein NT080_03105 [Spirochaetes bacterium]|nr:hypothetical protein [Spirochaetota bacterium]
MRRTPLAATCLVFSLMVACQASSGFFTEDERNELYAVVASRSEETIADGAVLSMLSQASFSVAILDGAQDPASFDLRVVDASDSVISTTSYVKTSSVGSRALGPGEKTVDSFKSGRMAPVVATEPADGYYRYEYDFRNEQGASLQSGSLQVFKLSSGNLDAEIGVYPSSFGTGDAGLLLARLETPASSRPYVKWSTGGVPLPEGAGLVSGGLDRIVWQGSTMPGAVTISMDLYPFPPAAGAEFEFDAPVRKTVKLLVLERGSGDTLLRSGNGFFSLFRLEGDAADARKGWGSTAFVGKPYLDMYPGGFGYRLGARPGSGPDAGKYSGAGIAVGNGRLPVSGGGLAPFSYVVRFLPEAGATGVIVSHMFDNGCRIALGAKDGFPYLSFEAPGKTIVFASPSPLPGRAMTLAVSLLPRKGRISVDFSYDGVVVSSQSAAFDRSVETWSFSGTASVAGPDGFPALYDDVGVYAAGAEGAADLYPAFQEAAYREYRDELVFASAFESAQPAIAFAPWAVRRELPGLVIPAGERFTAGKTVRSDKAFRFDLSGDPIVVAFEAPGGDSLAISFQRSGSFVVILGGKTVGAGSVPSGSWSIAFEPGSERDALTVGDARFMVDFPATGELRVSLANIGTQASVVETALLRYVREVVGKSRPGLEESGIGAGRR